MSSFLWLAGSDNGLVLAGGLAVVGWSDSSVPARPLPCVWIWCLVSIYYLLFSATHQGQGLVLDLDWAASAPDEKANTPLSHSSFVALLNF